MVRRFAHQGQTVSLRLKFVSLAFNSWQEVMQYMMFVRHNSVEEIFVSFIKLFADTWSS